MNSGSGPGTADKRASKIARHIEAEIVRRGWPIGESLGSEHALQQRFCVSRSVLREAVRLVEHHRVARMRRGPNGGLLICEPDAAPATRAVVIYLEYLGTTLGDLLNARLVLEPLAAALAAERIDEAGIDRLRAVLYAEEQWKPGLPSPREDFHIALAERSKNPVLQLFIDVLMRLTTRYARASRTDSAGDAVEAIDHVHHDHSEIVAAVTAGDSARANTLSERHVEAVTAWLQRRAASGGAAESRGTPRQVSRGAGGHHRRRHRRRRMAGRFGLRNRGGAAGTLPSEPRRAARSGAAARISLGGADAPRTRGRAGRHKTPGSGQHRHHRALPAVSQAQPGGSSLRPGRDRGR